MTAQTYPSTLDYSNRQVDVELLQSILKPSVNPQRVNVALVTKTPKVVAGMEKLAQRYALTLLTVLGDVHFDQTFGSNLMTEITNGSVQDKGSLNSLFGLANLTVARVLITEDSLTAVYGEIPADEQLQSATLLNADVDVNTSTIYMQVGLTTKAGSNMEFIIPTTTPR